MKHATRREFLRWASAVSLGFHGLRDYCLANDNPSDVTGPSPTSRGFGELVPDPDGILDLPRGFSYRVFSRTGDLMDDGFHVPGKHDGMAAFAGPDGKTILVRNHECEGIDPSIGAFGENFQLLDRMAPDRLYDSGVDRVPALGGTTTLVYDTREQRLERHFLSLAGTLRNCAGGPTPWGTWLSCEETEQRALPPLARDHGYAFEVPARMEIGLAEPVPLREMGRFRREAVAVDPMSGAIYQTEDMDEGLIYRFLPKEPGNLRAGGRLQALAIHKAPTRDTRNWKSSRGTIPVGQAFAVQWIDMTDVEAPQNDLRMRGFSLGAACFARGEGMWYGNGKVYFACTTGGKSRLGQIWCYTPSPAEGTPQEKDAPGTLELFIEPNDARLLENADNLTVAPWGDLILCEDGLFRQHLVMVTTQGQLFRIARNALNTSEFAGATFSPDGSTLFVNIQSPGLTLAISGFDRFRAREHGTS